VVFIAIALPMVPLVLKQIGVHELLGQVGRALLGGLPP
jgi:hypothetical protein